MRKLLYIGFIAALIVVSFAAGASWTHRRNAPTSAARTVLYYACPMHPQYHSDRAGDCPSCGMRLEPVYADGTGAHATSESAEHAVGSVEVSAERQQAIGVRLGVAERMSGSRMIRTTGRVQAKENATYQIVAGASGWIRDAGIATVGMQVRKNEVLARFYSPEIVPTEQAYFALLDSLDRVGANVAQPLNQGLGANVQRSADALRNMGVSDVQLEEMRRKRDITQDINIVSPVDGFVLARNISGGLRFDRGFEFYQIADLSRVWILTDVFEGQADYIKPGTNARVSLPKRDREFSARVGGSQALFDETSRTLKVRLEADNTGYYLKPGMFVDVEFTVDLPPTLTVPADAIVDTGLRKTLFVDRGNGYFEPRQVQTGMRIGDLVEVTNGLAAGERIVMSGTFLLDSESRMKATAQAAASKADKDPVCGMDVGPSLATAKGRKSVHRGRTYYFCSDECKRKFDKEPDRYAIADPQSR